ncbi:AI-2E family transporter [Rathayibacter soli]|uniref:AI-2E family transporter n=1 Tax=Rathayibacter soli TaxID=3144168 RepID=UPI0027E44CC7|nr:AI-2E family transporter [Glaciibacter superstes]
MSRPVASARRWPRLRSHPPTEVNAGLRRPFVVGLVVTLGALAAIVLGLIVTSLATILTYVGLALFIALGLDPIVRRMQAHRISRPLAVVIVFVVILIIVVAGLIFFVPPLVRQLVSLIELAPTALHDIEDQVWFVTLNNNLGETIDLNVIADWIRTAAQDPKVWAAATGGLLKFGAGLIGGSVGGVTVLILSIFFLASLPSMKQGVYALVARRSRPGFIDLSEQIFVSIGGYLNGMVLLAAINAALGFIAMLIFGVPFAGLLAIIVFLLALIPLVGSILATILVTIVALFNSPTTAIEIAVYYLIYMQVEAYVLTPRIMNKAVDVPGSLVVIGALAGGTLLGMLGALVAIPVTAAILLIIKKVVIPRQERAS